WAPLADRRRIADSIHARGGRPWRGVGPEAGRGVVLRRLWRWLTAADDDLLLRRSAVDLAAEVRRLSAGQQAELAAGCPELWWHVNRVVACVEMSGMRSDDRGFGISSRSSSKELRMVQLTKIQVN